MDRINQTLLGAALSAALGAASGCQSSPIDHSGGDTQTNWLGTTRSTEAYEPNPQIDDATYQTVIADTNEFGLDLFRTLAPQEENLFFSPASAAFSLVMTYAGARGNTQAEMKNLLHDTVADPALHAAMNRLALGISSENVAPHRDTTGEKSLQLLLTDAVWAQRGYPLVPDYLATLSRNYDAGVQIVDFAADPERSRQAINEWIADQTLDKVLDLLGPNTVTAATRLVLTNTLYFHGSWATAFDPVATQDAIFHTLSGTDVTASTMHRSELLGYVEGANYQMVELEYYGHEIVMTLLLPATGQLETVRSSLNQSWLAQAHANMSHDIKVDLALPRFRFTWGSSSLKPTLQALGMKDAFESSKADLTGMAPASDLYIQDVWHKAFVAVDEYGTDAAAATAVMADGHAMPATIKTVTIDRPFLFFLRDESGVLLFAGQVGDPTRT